VSVLSRSAGVDLLSGAGLDAALGGVDVIIGDLGWKPCPCGQGGIRCRSCSARAGGMLWLVAR